jgi:hypothetical protein
MPMLLPIFPLLMASPEPPQTQMLASATARQRLEVGVHADAAADLPALDGRRILLDACRAR